MVDSPEAGLHHDNNFELEQVRTNFKHAIDNIVEYFDSVPESPELNSELNKIDFNLLRSLFVELQKKTGEVNRELNFMDRSSVKYLDSVSAINFGIKGGLYIIGVGRIALDYEWLKENVDQHTIEEIILYVLCHEETHATSKESYNITNNPTGEATYIQTVRGGLSEIVRLINKDLSAVEQLDFNFVFNEGVTDKIAREIYNSYVKRSENNFKPLTETEEMLPKMGEDYNSVTKNIELVNAIIDHLAAINDFTKEQVWNALKRDYYAGNMIHQDKDTSELFDSDLFPEATKELRNAISSSDIDKFIENIKKSNQAF